jgi:glycerophosphoryl diester phosphodiesterase
MPGFVENTLGGFLSALAAGADVIESDIHVSRDGIPVLFHDDTLLRLTGNSTKISDMTARELGEIDLGRGEGVPTLEAALSSLPRALFNLDVKSPTSPEVTARVIRSLGAQSRVLLASFSERNHRIVKRLLPEVATSSSSSLAVRILIADRLGLRGQVRRMTRGITAVQIPTRGAGMDLTRRDFIARLHEAGVEVHYWVVDDPREIRRLLDAGADGVVTDDVLTARRVIDTWLAER